MSVEPDVIQMSNSVESKKQLINSSSANQELHNGNVAAVVNGVNHIQMNGNGEMVPEEVKKQPDSVGDFGLGPNLVQLRPTDGVRELQTVIRDRSTPRNDFIFYADRLIRLVVEEGLNKLPYRQCQVTTPTGQQYNGLRYEKGNCGVSIVRSGEAMEQGLRDCCRSIRIGKILIQSDEDTHDAKVVYANLPKDVHQRKVLLMYPIMCTGNTVVKALRILQSHGVSEANVVLLNLFCTPQAARTVMSDFPDLRILTSEVHPVSPTHFGQKYFGTE